MSEDAEEARKRQRTTRSGRSFGVGPVGDCGDLLSVSGTCPSASAAHLASSPLVESHETQLGSEVGLTATTNTESTVTIVATQMDLPVGSPPSSAPREAESNNILCTFTSTLPVTGKPLSELTWSRPSSFWERYE